MTLPSSPTVSDLNAVARRVRRHIVRMTAEANSGHPGGSLSATDILVALYFGGVMKHNPAAPTWPERDRFILSKGHITPGYYAVLAEAGYFPVDELLSFRKLGSRLQGHPIRGNPPGVEMSAGALGMGLSFSLGQALAGRLNQRDYQVFCLLSDGDCDEGQTWEAAMACAHHRAENIIAIVDYNHIQNDGYSDYSRYPEQDGAERVGGWVMPKGYTVNIMSTQPLDEKWRAFGWDVLECGGHDISSLIGALKQARAPSGRPKVIIANTTKGKGVSFMENNPSFHGKAPSPAELQQALEELQD